MLLIQLSICSSSIKRGTAAFHTIYEKRKHFKTLRTDATDPIFNLLFQFWKGSVSFPHHLWEKKTSQNIKNLCYWSNCQSVLPVLKGVWQLSAQSMRKENISKHLELMLLIQLSICSLSIIQGPTAFRTVYEKRKHFKTLTNAWSNCQSFLRECSGVQ